VPSAARFKALPGNSKPYVNAANSARASYFLLSPVLVLRNIMCSRVFSGIDQGFNFSGIIPNPNEGFHLIASVRPSHTLRAGQARAVRLAFQREVIDATARRSVRFGECLRKVGFLGVGL
jgi:hypothetical protein